jgi:hypothetical protein
VFHRIFQPSAKEPLNFEATIAHTVRDLTTRFAVRAVFFDPYQMAAVAQGLTRAGVPMREYPQTVGNLTEIGSNLFELIKARGIVVYPDAALRLAILRAVAVETPRGWKISKEKASHKIAGDGCTCGGAGLTGAAAAEYSLANLCGHAAQHTWPELRRWSGRDAVVGCSTGCCAGL